MHCMIVRNEVNLKGSMVPRAGDGVSKDVCWVTMFRNGVSTDVCWVTMFRNGVNKESAGS